MYRYFLTALASRFGIPDQLCSNISTARCSVWQQASASQGEEVTYIDNNLTHVQILAHQMLSVITDTCWSRWACRSQLYVVTDLTHVQQLFKYQHHQVLSVLTDTCWSRWAGHSWVYWFICVFKNQLHQVNFRETSWNFVRENEKSHEIL
jgi:hypothetical protein